jgi:hypothetical protein
MELGGFWWHLSTGQWMIDNLGIPREDPFTVTAAGGRDISFVLSAFWLCQVLYAVLHKLFGLYGIIALKAATFTLVFFIVIRSGKGGLPAYMIALPAIYVATFYNESRPQTFSFLFFALAIYLLEEGRTAYKEGKPLPRGLYALPGLMVVWANMHPGFVVGIPLIGVYVLEAAALASFARRRPPVGRFIVIGAASIALSALNPNGFEAAVLTVRMLQTTPAIHEHLPLKEFAEFTGGQGLYIALIALIAAGAASFAARWRKPDILHLIVFAAMSFMAIKTFRAGFFFAMFAVVVTGRNLSMFRLPAALRGRVAMACAACALLATFLTLLLPRTVIGKPTLAEGVFPDKAATFIEQKKLPPNIYHPYEWGGYLIWKLYPDYKVFIDSRGTGSVQEHHRVLNAEPGWDGILDKYGVNTVLYWPLLPFRADVPPIILKLQGDDNWSPVYWDSNSVVFVRSELAENPIRKDAVWELFTSLLFVQIEMAPANPDNYNSLGEIYAARGLRTLAAQAFREALSVDPRNTRAARNLASLQLNK